MNKKLTYFFVFFVTALFKLNAVNDSIIFKFSSSKIVNKDFGVSTGGGAVKIDLSQYEIKQKLFAKYTTGFNYEYTKTNYNDSLWKLSETHAIEIDSLQLKEVTYRIYYCFTGNSRNSTALLKLEHLGASCVYIDGVEIQRNGIPSDNKSSEICKIPENIAVVINKKDTLTHVITVRYSNWHQYNSVVYGTNPSFSIYYVEDFQADQNEKNLLSYFLLALGIFFLAISIVYFHLFLSYKQLIYNLYYFIFLLTLGLTILTPFFYRILTNIQALLFVETVNAFLIPVCLISLSLMVYSIFGLKRNWFYYTLIVVSVLFFITLIFDLNEFGVLFYVFIAFFCYFGLTSIAIKALLKKLNGAKYLGAGILSFTIFIIAAIICSTKLNEMALTYVCLSLSIISIPLYMSSFLSNQFAGISNSLTKELEANKILAQQNLEKEKEKKEILENQNKILEEQVISRTIEITEQKKELQAKNIEITDSIAYSKHIQTALIPEESEIIRYFKNSFVLYEPKDIVSGDFYWFKKNSETEFLIAAADCTGHGVPGALVSLIAIQSLNRATETKNDVNEILKQTNNIIKSTLKQNDPNNAKDGMDIALCKVNFLQNGKVQLSYAGANRPMYILRNGSSEIQEIKATKCAIGGFTDYDTDFNRTEFEFDSGDSVYLTSDGFADQFGSTKNKKLTTKRFKELLIKLNYLSGNLQKTELKKFILDWRGKLEQVDDILVIGLKF